MGRIFIIHQLMNIQVDSVALQQEDAQTPISGCLYIYTLIGVRTSINLYIESLGYMPLSGIACVMARETPFCTRNLK